MKALIAKISPSAKISISKQDVFAEPVIKECDYMLAIARPYTLGSDSTTFEIQFGTKEENFKPLLFKQINLSKIELNDWNDNDEQCYRAIALKLNITCLGFEEVDL